MKIGMKKIIIVTIQILTLIFLSGCHKTTGSKRISPVIEKIPAEFKINNPGELKYPDLHFSPPQPRLLRPIEGIDVYYFEDNETPSISVEIIFKSGSIDDPTNKEGLAALTNRLLRTGGTESSDGDDINEQLDFLGSEITIDVQLEYTLLSMWSLKKNFNTTWNHLMQMLIEPSFDPIRIKTEKRKEIEFIRRRWDEPMTTGFLLFNQLIYGKNYPGARISSIPGIENITRKDILGYYRDNIQGAPIIIGVTGKISEKEILSLVNKGFKKWSSMRKGQKRKRDLHPIRQTAVKPGIYFMDKPGLTQAVICMGHLGINRLDPDNARINILNYIYGSGGLNSRLMREIRTNKGLAYTAFGSVGKGRERGVFINFCMTKNNSVIEVISTIKKIMEDITQNMVSSKELTAAMNYEKNSFVHLFDSLQRLLVWKMIYRIFGYPGDYLESYLDRIEDTNKEKILEMAKRVIHPSDLVILVIGDGGEILPQLHEMSPWGIHELSFPSTTRSF